METVASGYVKSIEAGLAMVMVGGQCLTALANDIKPGEVFVCIRAEEVMLLNAAAASSARNQLTGIVSGISLEGPMIRVGVDCGISLAALVTHVSGQELGLAVGQRIVALIKAPSIHLIPRR